MRGGEHVEVPKSKAALGAAHCCSQHGEFPSAVGVVRVGISNGFSWAVHGEVAAVHGANLAGPRFDLYRILNLALSYTLFR